MTRSITIISFALLLNAGSVAADGPALPDPLTLADAQQIAREHNPALHATRQEIDVARADARQARLWPNPELELSAEDVPAEDVGLSRSENMIGLSQAVPFPGKRSRDVRIAEHAIAVAEWETARHESELARDVTMAFARAVVAERKVHQLGDLAGLAATMARATARRVESGAAPDQEQLRAELEHERARIDLASAQRDQRQARHALALLLGTDPDTLPALGDGLREQIDPATLPTWNLTTTAAHPAARAAHARRDQAEAAVGRARLDPWPDLTVGVAAGRNAGTDEDLVEFSVSLPLPVFDHGQARRQQARARARAARADVAAVDQQLREQFLTARARVVTAHDQVAAYRERMLPKAAEALRLVQAGFDAGKLGFADLIDTQRTATQVHLDYLERLLELNLALADWETVATTTRQ